MRRDTRHFTKICADHLNLQDPIYEFGSLQVSDSPLGNLRSLFPGRNFIGADMREGPGVDVTLNLHDIDLPDSSVGCIISLDTLEHVEYPRRAMSEIYRVLAPDGIAILSSVFDFPIHGYPNDYWRFTPEGFRSLLQDFNHRFVGSHGVSETVPRTIVGVGFKGCVPPLVEFENDFANWRKWYGSIMKKMAETGIGEMD